MGELGIFKPVTRMNAISVTDTASASHQAKTPLMGLFSFLHTIRHFKVRCIQNLVSSDV